MGRSLLKKENSTLSALSGTLDNYYTETGGDRASERLLPDTIRKLGLDGVVGTSGHDRNLAATRYL